MKNEMINAAYTEISNFRNKFGENLFAAIMEEDNTTVLYAFEYIWK